MGTGRVRQRSAAGTISEAAVGADGERAELRVGGAHLLGGNARVHPYSEGHRVKKKLFVPLHPNYTNRRSAGSGHERAEFGKIACKTFGRPVVHDIQELVDPRLLAMDVNECPSQALQEEFCPGVDVDAERDALPIGQAEGEFIQREGVGKTPVCVDCPEEAIGLLANECRNFRIFFGQESPLCAKNLANFSIFCNKASSEFKENKTSSRFLQTRWMLGCR